jgi:hypothetical protein
MPHRLIGLLTAIAVGFLVVPLSATAQLPPTVPRVGFFHVSAPLSLCCEEAFRYGFIHSVTWPARILLPRSALLCNKGGRRTC